MTKSPLAAKVAVITGAGSGIGRASALALARAGARVVASDLDATRAKETAGLIHDEGGEAIDVPCDAGSPAELAALMQKTIDAYGQLDLACNNAGMDPPNMPMADGAVGNWEESLRVNLSGTWHAMRLEIELMLANDSGGAIVNVSSIAGMRGIRGETSYASAKHGVIGLTQSAALDYARKGIRINAVCPGPILTPMLERYLESSGVSEERLGRSLPIGRLGTSEEVANGVLWLLSPAASFVTGHALAVDGGYLAK
jgi:NAD(P)-dependent dehydrogenase (short-subunit alcohol dehydrogenase family)